MLLHRYGEEIDQTEQEISCYIDTINDKIVQLTADAEKIRRELTPLSNSIDKPNQV